MFMRISTAFCVAGSIALCNGIANAAAVDEVAQTLAVKSTSTASGRVLHGADIILERDRIDTSASGEVQLEFLDQSRVLIGPNSSLGIQQYLASAKRTKKHVGVVALGGAVRFISGSTGKQGYTIRTPTATIGVRGTAFDVAVTATRTAVLVYEGYVQLCSSGRCVQLDSACDIGVADGRSAPTLTNSFALEQNVVRRDFPYAYTPRAMPKEFRVNSAACVKRADLREIDTPDPHPTQHVEASRPVPPDMPAKDPKPEHEHHHKGDHHEKDGHHHKDRDYDDKSGHHGDPDHGKGDGGTDKSDAGKDGTGDGGAADADGEAGVGETDGVGDSRDHGGDRHGHGHHGGRD